MNILCRLGFHQRQVTKEFLGIGETSATYHARKVRWFRLTYRCPRCGTTLNTYKYFDATRKKYLKPEAEGYNLLSED